MSGKQHKAVLFYQFSHFVFWLRHLIHFCLKLLLIGKELLLSFCYFAFYLVAFVYSFLLLWAFFFFPFLVLTSFDSFLIFFFVINFKYFLCGYHGVYIKYLIIIEVYFKLIITEITCIKITPRKIYTYNYILICLGEI